MRLPQITFARPVALGLCFLPMIPEVLVPNGALVLFAVVAILLLLSPDVRQATLRWHNGSAARELAIGTGLGAAYAAANMLAIDPLIGHLLGARTDLSSFAHVRGNLANALVLLAIAWVIGAVAEEVSHRGFLIGWGSRLLGPRATVPLLLLTSAVFGLPHLYQGPVGAISSTLSGLVFGMIYLWRRQTLLAPIMAHGIFDTIGVTAIYFGYGLA